MCVIVVKQSSSDVVKYPSFDDLFAANPDGVGIAVWVGNSWRVCKAVDRDVCARLYELFKRAQTPVVIHFRLATAGEVSTANVHPFGVRLRGGQKAWLFHNGVLRGFGNSYESDTRQFADFLSLLRPRAQDLVRALEEHFPLQKFAVCLPSGRVVAVGNFVRKDGLLFSNLAFEVVHRPFHVRPAWANVGGRIIGRRYDHEETFLDPADIDDLEP